jgi:hypothetical protein
MSSTAMEIEREMEAYSRQLASEATYYWQCHQPRYRYLLKLLEDLRKR